jgi:hypothetical protein
MRTITIDIPFGLTIILHTRLPGRLWIYYKARTPETNRPNATSSTLESRSQFDEIIVDVPPGSPKDTFVREFSAYRQCTSLKIVLNQSNATVPAGLQRSTSRASVRTEIAYNDGDWNLEDWMPYFQEHHIKVRDFCFEPSPTSQKAFEIFDPCLALLHYERMVKMRAKEIRQLYHIRWLTKEQALTRLSPEELEICPSEYPWTPLKVERPTGTRDEVMAALRHHLKRTYRPDDEVANIEVARNIAEGKHAPTLRDVDSHSQQVDIEMSDVSSDAVDSTLAGDEWSHSGDMDAEVHVSLSSTSHTIASHSPTLQHSPTPPTITSIQRSSTPIPSSVDDDDTIVSSQNRPRGLARTQTLLTF